MTIGSKEFYEIIEEFEKNFSWCSLDKEDVKLWEKGYVYRNGETNNLYKAYRLGYSLGRSNYQD